MKYLFSSCALVALLFAPTVFAESPEAMSVDPLMADCFNCSKSDSTDKCKDHQQCKGTRKHCRDIGCKIVGTASCSTAANVKICEYDGSSLQAEAAEADALDALSIDPLLADCFNCSKSDSTDKCKDHQQCKGTRKHCRDIGCKIVGTASCSTAANVKICEYDGSSLEAEAAEAAEQALDADGVHSSDVSIDMCLM